MPIYEYQCQACGKHHEEMQKITAPDLVTCPACGQPQLKKLISHTSFQLKGGGYYATDYKPAPAPAEKPAEKAPEKPAESSLKSTPSAEDKK